MGPTGTGGIYCCKLSESSVDVLGTWARDYNLGQVLFLGCAPEKLPHG